MHHLDSCQQFLALAKRNANLPRGYQEGMFYGIISWYVTHELSRHLHFRKTEDLPLDVVAEVIAREPLDRFVTYYETVRRSSRKSRRR